VRRILAIAFCVNLICTIGCKKDVTNPDDNLVSSTDTTSPLELEFLDYWCFGVGSYWIYSDIASGVVDTVTLASLDIDPDYSYGPSEFEGTLYTMLLLHSSSEVFGESKGEIRVGGHRPDKGDWGMIMNWMEVGPPTGPLYSFGMYDNYMVFHYPFEEGDTVHSTTNISDVATLVTPSGTYENTVRIDVDVKSWYSLENANYVTYLFLTKGIGTTRMTTGSGYDLVLVDYSINPL